MSEHIVPTRVYYTIFGILMLCACSPCRWPSPILARSTSSSQLVIAVFKATLVILFFMHVKYAAR